MHLQKWGKENLGGHDTGKFQEDPVSFTEIKWDESE